MFKDLLVHIPTERSARPAVDGSVSLAMMFDAHLDALAIGYESTNIPFVAEGGAAVASIYEIERERAMERAVTALDIFEAKAKASGISYRCEPVGSAGLHRLHRQRHIAMAGDQDHGAGRASVPQFSHKLDPAHIGHANIRNDASRGIGSHRRQKRVR